MIDMGSFSLPTYYVFLSFVLTITTLYVYKRAEKKQYSGTTAMDLYLISLGAGILGARAMHIFYEAPDHYLQNPLRAFYFWEGGFVYYGGAIAAFLAGLIALKVKQQSFPMWLDFFTPVASIGYALGRIACFLAGCCYGKVCDLPWAVSTTLVEYPSGFEHTSLRHPVQLYATLIELILFVLILWLEQKKWFKRPGNLFAFWLSLHALSRIAIELLRDDDRGATMGGLSISTRISILIIILIFFKKRQQSIGQKVP